jgi:hypothetical protein
MISNFGLAIHPVAPVLACPLWAAENGGVKSARIPAINEHFRIGASRLS